MTGVLARPGFRALFVADLLSQLGSHSLRISIPLIAVLSLDASEAQVGLLAACTTIPTAVLSLPVGAWVDRVRHRPVLIGCDIARAVMLVSIPVAAWLGVLGMGWLYVVALLLGALGVGFDTAYLSHLPRLVERDQLVAANAVLEGVYSGGQVVGRGLGGVLVQAVGAPFAVLAGGVGYLWSAMWITRIREDDPAPAAVAGRRLGREIADGVRFLAGNRVLRWATLAMALLFTGLLMLTTVLVLLITRELGYGGAVVGAVSAAGGVGALLGAAIAARLDRRFGARAVLLGSVALATPPTIVLAFVDGPAAPVLIGIQQALLWAGVTVLSVVQAGLRLRIAPPDMVGRVVASARTLVWVATPLGSLVGGLLSGVVGPRGAALVATGVMLAAVVPLLFMPAHANRPSSPVS